MDTLYLAQTQGGDVIEGTASQIVTKLRCKDWNFSDLPIGEASDLEYREAVAERVKTQSGQFISTADAEGFLMSLALAGTLTVKELPG